MDEAAVGKRTLRLERMQYALGKNDTFEMCIKKQRNVFFFLRVNNW